MVIEKNKNAQNTENSLIHNLTSSPFKAFLKEVGLFAGIFATVFIISVVFVNANLIYHTIKDAFTWVEAANYDFQYTDGQQASNSIEQLGKEETIETKDILRKSNVSAKITREASLQSKTYSFSYSMIPPEHRIFIPSIGVDAPIIDVSAATEDKLKHGNFTNELASGVVKYPSTANPGTRGNSLIFWHTSYYRWKKNWYGEIFAKIFDLKEGAIIKIAWWWQLYNYEVVAKVFVTPSKVDEEYNKYTNGEYVTLMGCYPIGSDSKRWLIIAKRIKDKETNSLTIE